MPCILLGPKFREMRLLEFFTGSIQANFSAGKEKLSVLTVNITYRIKHSRVYCSHSEYLLVVECVNAKNAGCIFRFHI